MISVRYILGKINAFMGEEKQAKGWKLDLVPKQNGRKFSVIVLWCLCFDRVGTLLRVNGKDAKKYIAILDNNFCPIIVRHFPTGNYLFAG